MPDKRTEFVGLRLARAEAKMLTELAAADGLYQSDVLRLLIRKTHAERFGAARAKPKRRR
jgi:hypothetical protein